MPQYVGILIRSMTSHHRYVTPLNFINYYRTILNMNPTLPSQICSLVVAETDLPLSRELRA